MDRKITTTAETSLAKRIEDSFAAFEITPGLKRLFAGFTAASFFGFGIRSALRHTRGLQTAEFSRAKLVSGVNFASKALGVTTVLTVSGYALVVIGISALLDVNTPRQFGDKMKQVFGNKYRLEKKESVSSFREVLRSAEVSSSEVTSSFSTPEDSA